MGHIKESKWESTVLWPSIAISLGLEHFWVADLGSRGIFGHLKIDRTQCVVGLPGDVRYDGGCPISFGTYKGKASGS